MARNLFEYKKVRADLGDPALPCQIGVVTKVVIPKPAAESNDKCTDYLKLTDKVQTINDGLDAPDVARNVKLSASSAITTKVTVYGERGSKSISEEITLTGTTPAAGSLAFDRITAVKLPVQTTTPVAQKGTVEVSAVTAAGTATLTFTSAATGAAYTIACALATADVASATKAAAKIVKVLNADAKFAAAWVAASAAAVISITAKDAAAQDATLNLVVTADGDTGLTLAAINAAATSGVAPDRVRIGFGKKFGIPILIENAAHVLLKQFNGSADTGTVTIDSADIEKNVIELNGTPDGKKDIAIVCLKF